MDANRDAVSAAVTPPAVAIVPQVLEEDENADSDIEHDNVETSILSNHGAQAPTITENRPYSRNLSTGDGFIREISSPNLDRYYSEIQMNELHAGHDDAATMSRHAHTLNVGNRLNIPGFDPRQAAVNLAVKNLWKSRDFGEMSRQASASMFPRQSSMILTDQPSFLGIRAPSSIKFDVDEKGMIIEVPPPTTPEEDEDKYKGLSFSQKYYRKFKNSPYVANFMKGATWWYKALIVFFLIINPIIFPFHNVAAGWLLLIEFIITLALAVQNYPLEPGGLLAFEALCIGMTTSESVIHEIEKSLEVVLLLIFMVAATHFLKRLLLFCFAVIVLSINNKIILSICFSCAIAVMSAFLDALTVTAVMISVTLGYIGIYDESRENEQQQQEEETEGNAEGNDENTSPAGGDGVVGKKERVNGPAGNHEVDVVVTPNVDKYEDERKQFHAFLRDILIHGIVATAYGGALTSVGEPQNLVVASYAGWKFDEFFYRMVAITFPVVGVSLFTLVLVEMTGTFGFGNQIPPTVRKILADYKEEEIKKMTSSDRASLRIQGVVAVFIVIGLGVQLAPVGIIGLGAIILVTVFNGVTEEHDLGKAFQDSLPFLSLLVVFFAIAAVIDTQGLFNPILDWILSMDSMFAKSAVLFVINGVLSMVSDNVFVATVFMNELTVQFCRQGVTRAQYDLLGIAILSGVNILGVGTPNGQAAFLFLLTSKLAPIVGLSYMRMFYMCLPYTLLMSTVGLITNLYAIPDAIANFEGSGLIPDHHDDFCDVCNGITDLCGLIEPAH